MSRIIICDDRDEELWKRERRKYLSASDMVHFLTNEELDRFGWERKRWFLEPETIYKEKETGNSRKFGKNAKEEREAKARMYHGLANEDHNRRKILGDMLGLRSRPCHLMVGSSRWPYLSCTLDALVSCPSRPVGLFLEGTTAPLLMESVLDQMEFAPARIGIAELKQTNMFGARNWLGQLKSGAPPGIPGYNQCQMQAQMLLTGIPWSLGVAQCGVGDATVCYLELNSMFESVLDRLNTVVQDRIDVIRDKLEKEKQNG